ncbi:unnamed protein product [[Actinomadura] parvosata subsp. kistnae]|uniref:hypothetical protein n=1 Tax=[Actinomadura] parvosata TaxID=1955412 RepID=UPI000D2B957B|nr:unnamed protein product [Actinomadura parvosata subsp. kistnae]
MELILTAKEGKRRRGRHSVPNVIEASPAGTYGKVAWLTLPQDYLSKKGHRIGLLIAGTDRIDSDESGTGTNVTVGLPGSSLSVPFVLSTPLADVPKDGQVPRTGAGRPAAAGAGIRVALTR